MPTSFAMVDLAGQGFAVRLKYDCPHVGQLSIREITNEIAEELYGRACQVCGHRPENWVDLSTHKVLCSRYQNKHMLEHYENSKAAADAGEDTFEDAPLPPCGHCVAVSFSDLSAWCFECEEYIGSELVLPTIRALQHAKFDADVDSDSGGEDEREPPTEIGEQEEGGGGGGGGGGGEALL